MGAVARAGQGRAEPAVAGRIAASGRLRLRHGPVDVILDLAGADASVAAAEAAVRRSFAGLLDALVAELPLLRAPVAVDGPVPRGPVARRMWAAVLPHLPVFVTPMAAVAGAVADHLCAAALRAAPLARIMVNDGGDIALWLAPGESCRIAVGAPGRAGFPALLDLRAADGIGGVATSGWRGRSQSLGIADAVTVLAADAAAADAAATLIANAVDLPRHPGVTRRPATDLAPDSDLGDRPVTVAVGALPPEDRDAALEAGLAVAEAMAARGLIRGAFLHLQGASRIAGPFALPAPARQEGDQP